MNTIDQRSNAATISQTGMDATADLEICSFDEAVARYYGEWVLMKVLAFDDRFIPVQGVVLAHSSDRGAISAALRQEPPRQPNGPFQPYYTFIAYPRICPDETIEQASARFAAERAAVMTATRA
jgi:hypothetical protein